MALTWRSELELYDVDNDEAVREQLLARLDRILAARGVILGVPSDVGAGFVRGANLGPQEITASLRIEL